MNSVVVGRVVLQQMPRFGQTVLTPWLSIALSVCNNNHYPSAALAHLTRERLQRHLLFLLGHPLVSYIDTP